MKKRSENTVFTLFPLLSRVPAVFSLVFPLNFATIIVQFLLLNISRFFFLPFFFYHMFSMLWSWETMKVTTDYWRSYWCWIIICTSVWSWNHTDYDYFSTFSFSLGFLYVFWFQSTLMTSNESAMSVVRWLGLSFFTLYHMLTLLWSWEAMKVATDY